MEPTKTPPTPAPSPCPPPSASGAQGGNGVATATGTSPRDNGNESGRTAQRVHIPGPPVLRFTPYAWAKLLFFRDAGDTEIGGFGITSLTEDDLLLVEDFQTVTQMDSSVTVAFDDNAVADFFDAQVDLGRRPEQFSRIWIHSHPGNSASPSGTDEETMARVFGVSDWAVMFILARGGQTYSRLRFNVGPGGEQVLKTEIDFSCCFAGSDEAAWTQEYEANILTLAPAIEMTAPERRRVEETFHTQRPRPRRPNLSSDDQELQEVLLDEYAQYWGVEREGLL